MARQKLKRLHSHKPRKQRPTLHKAVAAYFAIEKDARPEFFKSAFDLGPATHRAYYVRLAIEHQLPGQPYHDGSVKMKDYGFPAPGDMRRLLVAVSQELRDNPDHYQFMVTAPLISSGPGKTLDELSGAITAVTTP